MVRLSLSLGALAVLAATTLSAPAFAAATQLITNGDFEATYSTGTQSASTPSQLNYNGYGVTGWTNTPSNGYVFLFNPNLAGSAAYTSNGQYGNLSLYTSANGGSASAPASLVSPTGGNFLGSDGAFQNGTISQTVNNLTVGYQYNLSFYWAASQQSGYSNNGNPTTEQWGVTFGNATQNTAVISAPDQGFSGWKLATMTFKASATSQVLSFLAAGTPSGVPPFALLDGVSLVQSVPEPGSLLVVAAGLGAIALIRRRNRNA